MGSTKDCIYLALTSIGQPIQFSTTAIAGEAHDIYSGSSPMFMAAGSNWATADAVPLLFILIWINST